MATDNQTIQSPVTPGPWRANGQTVFDCDGEEICTRGEAMLNRHFADARLIAAAPDLLAACEAALLREDVADGELGDLLRKAVECARVGGFPLPSRNGEWRRLPETHMRSVWRHPPATHEECYHHQLAVRCPFLDRVECGTPLCPECGREMEFWFLEICDGKEDAR